MKLTEIRDNDGARKARLRVGRGIGSSKGKTAGRGVKGQTSRSGVSINGFEGGQMPIYRRLPKRGFTNVNTKTYVAVNLDRLQTAIEAGKLSKDGTIDTAALVKAGVVTHPRDGIRLLARGVVTYPITIEVAGASAAAIAVIEKAGGKVIVTVVKATAEDAAA